MPPNTPHTHFQLCRLSLTCCDGITWLCVEADADLTFLHAKPWLCLCLQSTPCVQISCHRLLLAAEGHLPRTGCFLGSSSVELDLIHRPHGTFYIFQPYETFVEAQVVPDRILIRTKRGNEIYILLGYWTLRTQLHEDSPSRWLHCSWNRQSFSWTSCRFRLTSADCAEIQILPERMRD